MAQSQQTAIAFAPLPVSGTRLYGGLFAVSVMAFCLGAVTGGRLGWASDIIAIAANATCGWSWLLVRALFHPTDKRAFPWPLAIVFVIAVAGAVLRFRGADDGVLPRMAGNIEGLISSAILLLATIEPLRGLRPDLLLPERRFRLIFAGVYMLVLTVAVVWINGSPAGSLAAQWGMMIKVACALLALTGMGAAVWYRRRHPLPESGLKKRREPTMGEADLSARILGLMADADVYTVANLKASDLARRLSEAEYKVTQSITGTLGFRNFNHMINYFRIAEASRRLSERGLDHLPVLTIALACGFGSIGPFNRAFKAEMKVTPTDFRVARRTG